MIDQLITALSKEVEMSAEEIADTIWLALQMQEFQAESVSSGFPLNKEDEIGINKQESQSEQGILPKTSELGETPTPSPEKRKAGIYPRNQQHTSKSLDLSFKVPVFTLEPDKVATWAQMLSGKGGIWTLGYVFKLDATPVQKESGLFNLAYGDLSAEQRVQAFRVTAQILKRLGGKYVKVAEELELNNFVRVKKFIRKKIVPPQFQSLIADKTEGFVGREYVFDAIEAFIANNPKGYFPIIGDPGQGKSAILAKYVQDTVCIAHFNVLLQGPNRADQFLESVCRQLIERYELDYDSLPPNATRDGEFLGQLLDEVAQKRDGEAVIIAVDALDEVDSASYRDAANILYLPAYLPDGVYFILTRRRGVEVPLTSFAPMQTLNLLDLQTDGEQDVRTYIENRVNGSENLRHLIDERGETITEFTNKIAQKSETNFMYLRYVLLDIESGLYQDLTLEQFPQGLQGYYEFHWQRMGMTADPLPVEKIKIIYILGEVRQPVSRRRICDFSGETEYTVQQVLNEWKQFLYEVINNGEKLYTIYNSSFRDFIHRQDILEKHPVTIPGIHQLIAKNELKVWQKLKGVLKSRKDE